MYIPYNSRLEYHKSIFGAVKTDQTVTFRIILPRDFCCHAAKLVIKKAEADEYGYINMQWDCMEGVGEEWWKVDFTAEKAALYKYHFEYDTSWGTSRIYHAGNGLAAIKGDGEDWQLTVYDKDFHTPEWLRGGIIYQIFPDRFASSGTKKQNVPSDRVLRTDRDGDPYWIPTAEGKVLNNDYFGGDLNGIEQKLGYLKSLGVTCIYLNPIFEAQSNHRYDTANYEKIDSMLGTEKDFKSLCESAKKLGIRIMLDGVFSHTGDDSRYFNRYSRYDSLGAYQSKESPYYGWYKFNKWPDDYESWWGIEILPEVNEDNSDFIEYITGKNGIARKWLKLGASGWRLDVADELPDEFLDEFRKAVKEEKADGLVLGEVWEDASNKSSYGKLRRYLLGKQLDSVMNYPFAGAVIDFIRDANAELFASRVMSIVENYPKEVLDVLMNHLSTHDTMRAITALAGENCAYRDRKWQSTHSLDEREYHYGMKLLMAASAMQFALPGVPTIYYGDEAGMQGYKDPFNRRCYPWGKENGELVEWYKKLGKIRNENSVFKDGRFEILSAVAGCVAFSRKNDDEAILVISNSNPHPITYYVKSEWCDAHDLLGNGKVAANMVDIEEKSTVILKRK
ncbi:alpha amylase catalytic domain protein [Ruminococcus sp. CAG:488]|nr:alpha amylase catalytic domain protein [Ruminococcus sp. CAG:488]